MTRLDLILFAEGWSDPLRALVWAAALLALAAGVVWPERGLLSWIRRSRRLAQRVQTEDALKHLYHAEGAGAEPTLQSLAGALQVSLNRAAGLVEALQAQQWLELSGGRLRLSADGRRYALNIIRAHRLWEQHLAEQTGVEASEWHRRAERKEHFISPEEARRLETGLGHPLFDPHGDPIPSAEGEMLARESSSIVSLPADTLARIVHVEDEPEAVFAQITAAGLYPGMVVRILENTPQRVRLWAQGQECVLAPVVAANLSAIPIPAAANEPAAARSLSELATGESAKVIRLSPRCRGAERRRLMDLGILPGTVITAELMSPAGNLTAFRVRNALIALRAEQSCWIHIEPPAAIHA